MSIVIQLHTLSYIFSIDRVVFLAADKEEIQDIIRTLIFSLSFHVSWQALSVHTAPCTLFGIREHVLASSKGIVSVQGWSCHG